MWFGVLCQNIMSHTRTLVKAQKHSLYMKSLCTPDWPIPISIMHIWSDGIDENCSEWNGSVSFAMCACVPYVNPNWTLNSLTHMDSDRCISLQGLLLYQVKMDVWKTPKTTHSYTYTHEQAHLNAPGKTYFNDVIWWVGKLMFAAQNVATIYTGKTFTYAKCSLRCLSNYNRSIEKLYDLLKFYTMSKIFVLEKV